MLARVTTAALAPQAALGMAARTTTVQQAITTVLNIATAGADAPQTLASP
jgi:hypothetical protein